MKLLKFWQVGGQIRPLFKDALRELFLESFFLIFVHFGKNAVPQIEVIVEPTSLFDVVKDSWELFFLLWQIDELAADDLLDDLGGDFGWLPQIQVLIHLFFV